MMATALLKEWIAGLNSILKNRLLEEVVRSSIGEGEVLPAGPLNLLP